jgi:hypothetical protein
MKARCKKTAPKVSIPKPVVQALPKLVAQAIPTQSKIVCRQVEGEKSADCLTIDQDSFTREHKALYTEENKKSRATYVKAYGTRTNPTYNYEPEVEIVRNELGTVDFGSVGLYHEGYFKKTLNNLLQPQQIACDFDESQLVEQEDAPVAASQAFGPMFQSGEQFLNCASLQMSNFAMPALSGKVGPRGGVSKEDKKIVDAYEIRHMSAVDARTKALKC